VEGPIPVPRVVQMSWCRPGRVWRGHRPSFILALSIVLSLTTLLDARCSAQPKEIISPTNHERLPIEDQDFPDYGDATTWRRIGIYPIRPGSPVQGSYGVGYEDGRSLVFEVILDTHGPYLHALVLYRDGRVPALFIKQGVGAIFRRADIPEWWKPSRLFEGYTPPEAATPLLALGATG
jgi:hypothetical protein